MIHFTPERNYTELATPFLTEVLGLIEAQIGTAEDTLRALTITRNAMAANLAERSSHAEG